MSPRAKAAANGDALCILSGHGGRILCVKSAWHGDRLLSGGADRTVRLWDIAGSGGKCLVSMSGHLGWVTHVRYWGPNTIVSASTDRSVLLWDARVRSRPLFSLRHHHAPVSDILVGARTDPMVFSASSDGSVAAWDFRLLGQTSNTARVDGDNFLKSKSVSIRSPPYSMHLDSYSSRRLVNGPVLLCRGVRLDRSTVLNVGTDCVVREWDYTRDNVISEHATGHCDLVSSFTPIYKGQAIDWSLDCSPEQSALGTVTTSWDGTVRLRTLVRS
jgi:WD40 repeat protein